MSHITPVDETPDIDKAMRVDRELLERAGRVATMAVKFGGWEAGVPSGAKGAAMLYERPREKFRLKSKPAARA